MVLTKCKYTESKIVSTARVLQYGAETSGEARDLKDQGGKTRSSEGKRGGNMVSKAIREVSMMDTGFIKDGASIKIEKEESKVDFDLHYGYDDDIQFDLTHQSRRRVVFHSPSPPIDSIVVSSTEEQKELKTEADRFDSSRDFECSPSKESFFRQNHKMHKNKINQEELRRIVPDSTDSSCSQSCKSEAKLGIVMLANDKLHKRLESLTETVTALQYQYYNNECKSSSSNSGYGQRKRGFPESRDDNYKRRKINIRCFVCDKVGHKYMNCRKATAAQRIKIRDRTRSERLKNNIFEISGGTSSFKYHEAEQSGNI